MDEPPVIKNQQANERGNQYANTPADWNAFGQPPRKPKGRNRALWIVAIFVVGAVLLMCTFMGYALYSFSAKTKASEAYLKTREKPNQSLPRNLVSTLKSAEPTPGTETDAFMPLIAAIAQHGDEHISTIVDMDRLTREIQDSGLGRGVGGLARLLWRAQLEDILTVPDITYLATVIDVEWLVANQEARLVVLDESYYGDDTLWLLYVSMKDGEWKLYDWRQILQPMSEAQYYAIYSAASPLTQDNYAEFSNDAWNIYYRGDSDLQQLSREIYASYLSYTFPPELKPYAQFTCVNYLLDCGQTPELEQLLLEMSQGTAGVGIPDSVHFFNAKQAAQNGKLSVAFAEAEKFLAKVGWHPQAATIAGRSAQTLEEKEKAANWLARSLLLSPSNETSAELFFELASSEAVSNLVSSLAELPDGVEQCKALLSTLEYGASGGNAFVELKEAIANNDTLHILDSRVELGQMIASGHAADAIKVFKKVLAQEVNQDEIYDLESELVALSFFHGLFEEGYAATGDRESFFMVLCESYALEWVHRTEDWQGLLDFLQKHRADPDFAASDFAATDSEQADQTEIAIGRCLVELGKPQEAWDALVPLLERDRNYYLEPASPPGAVVLLDSLALAASSLGSENIEQFRSLVNDPKLAFLLLAKHLHHLQMDVELLALLEWYKSTEDTPAWSKYYQAQLALADGDWEAADHLLAQLAKNIESTESEMSFDDSDLYWFADPVEFDLSANRLDIAVRLGKLKDLLSKIREEPNGDWEWSLELAIDNLMDSEQIADSAEVLAETDYEPFDSIRLQLLARASLLRRDWESSMNYLKRASKYGSSGYYDNSYEFLDEILRIAINGNVKNLDAYHDLLMGPDDWQLLQTVEAANAGDREAFAGFVATLSNPAWFASDEATINTLREAGLWDTYNSIFAVNTEDLISSRREAGLALLSKPVATVQQRVLETLQSQYAEVLTHDKNRFPRSRFVYSVATNQGSFAVVGYDGLPPGIAPTSELARRFQDCQGSVFFTVASYELVPNVGEMRMTVAKIFRDVAAAMSYSDFRSGCTFEGRGWQGRLEKNANNGIDPERPFNDLTKSLPNADCSIVGSNTGEQLSISYVVEERVALLNPAQSSKTSSRLEFAEASVLLPSLKAGTKIKRPFKLWNYDTSY